MPEDQLHEGRVIRVYGGRCVVQTDAGAFDCGLRGKMRLAEEKTVIPPITISPEVGGGPIEVENALLTIAELPHAVHLSPNERTCLR